MFKDSDELENYVHANYQEVADNRIDEAHWDLQCTYCKVVRGFQVIKRELSGNTARGYMGYSEFRQDFAAPVTYLFRCPVCKAFKQWIVYEFVAVDCPPETTRRYFRVTSVPSEGLEDIDELPADPTSLRTAYRQAIRSMDANAPLAAAAMFRRALQVITRDLLGAAPSSLGKELNQVVGKNYNGVVVTNNFATVGYIVKEAGNQGAHPDKDPDLLDFTPEDAQDLQHIFMELVSELFIVPAATKRAKDNFLTRRKISKKP
jgi:Domain of unknown function (DUF4145)